MNFSNIVSIKVLEAVLMLSMVGCSSKVILMPAEPISYKTCNVRVFSSKDEAIKNGPIEELCIISGTSAGSWSHNIGTAISKHKNKVCSCGANHVYVQHQDAGTEGTASVTLIGFRYKK